MPYDDIVYFMFITCSAGDNTGTETVSSPPTTWVCLRTRSAIYQLVSSPGIRPEAAPASAAARRRSFWGNPPQPSPREAEAQRFGLLNLEAAGHAPGPLCGASRVCKAIKITPSPCKTDISAARTFFLLRTLELEGVARPAD